MHVWNSLVLVLYERDCHICVLEIHVRHIWDWFFFARSAASIASLFFNCLTRHVGKQAMDHACSIVSLTCIRI